MIYLKVLKVNNQIKYRKQSFSTSAIKSLLRVFKFEFVLERLTSSHNNMLFPKHDINSTTIGTSWQITVKQLQWAKRTWRNFIVDNDLTRFPYDT